MSKIISIGTALPAYKHEQETILGFMQQVYASNEVDKRKLKFLYHQSSIDYRYSVVPDYSRQINDWKFYPNSESLEPFPTLETRMGWFNRHAPSLSVDAIRNCVDGVIPAGSITHLITVSCTGMSAPGLDIQIMELMDLPRNIERTSVNFMGCYAAIHALKMADAVCKSDRNARVMIVCTELCTLHFQKESTSDNIASSLLFGDGSAAALVCHDDYPSAKGMKIESFYSEIVSKGKKDMAWELSSNGFLMTLSSYVPELIEGDFEAVVDRALVKAGQSREDIGGWCVHPGGRRILDAITKSLKLAEGSLQESYDVLKRFGNMSSPTILFVLKEMMKSKTSPSKNKKLFGAAFGPGLTVETFVLSPTL